MISDKLVSDSINYARAEIEKYGLPSMFHLNLSLEKAREIAEKMGADAQLAVVGTALMDIKLGEAFKTGKQPQHVQMGVDASREFFRSYDLQDFEKDKIINCIEAHHGAVPFSCTESEVATNADCYRFMHPAGVLFYITTLTKRGLTMKEIITQAESKLDEKRKLLSLNVCQAELLPFYQAFKSMFAASLMVAESIQT